MVETKRFAPFAALALTVLLALVRPASAEIDGLRLEGVSLRASERTTELHRLIASEAIIEPGSNRLLATQIRLTSTLDGSRDVLATAERGFIPVSGELPPEQEDEARPEINSLEQLLAYAQNFELAGIYGDIFLVGGDEPVNAEVAGEAQLRADQLIWSRLFDMVVIPVPFTQTGRGQGESLIEASAGASLINKQFSSWTYFATAERPIRIVYTIPLTEEEGIPAND